MQEPVCQLECQKAKTVEIVSHCSQHRRKVSKTLSYFVLHLKGRGPRGLHNHEPILSYSDHEVCPFGSKKIMDHLFWEGVQMLTVYYSSNEYQLYYSFITCFLVTFSIPKVHFSPKAPCTSGSSLTMWCCHFAALGQLKKCQQCVRRVFPPPRAVCG